MAKKPKDIKPLFAVKADFEASLDRFVHEAGMLHDAITTLISMGAISEAVAGILKERIDAFDAARFSRDDEGDQ